MKKSELRFYVFIVIVFLPLQNIFSQINKQKSTVITPHLNVEINEGENVVFTSSFHSAWTSLKNDILKENIDVEKDIRLVNYLNKMNEIKTDPGQSVSLSGFVGDGIDKKINDLLKTRFQKTVDLSSYTNDPSNIICYSYFNKLIKFETKFETFDSPFPFFDYGKPADIMCFGIWTCGESEHHQKIKEQVKVIDFKNRIDFILSLSNPNDNDEIIIALVIPSETLLSTIQKTKKRIRNSKPTELVDNDRLIIPRINFDIAHKYHELIGIHLANKGYEDYFFAEANHDILFTLDESGASADSQAKIILKKGPGPRTMIVNRPFLIMMKEKNSENPYFAAWIGNNELLVNAE